MIKAEIELTEDQKKAYTNIIEWFEDLEGEKYRVLSGYSGSGKTTLLNELAKYANKNSFNTLFTATTNKAVKVLRSRIDYDNFSTIHSALNIKPKKQGRKQIFVPDKYSNNDISGIDLLVIDECSMISSNDRYDDNGKIKRKSLLTIIKEETEMYKNMKVLFCGDPAQLQPINENRSKCFDYDGDFLYEVVRHGDGISNKAKLVREKEEYVPIKNILKEPEISMINLRNIIKEFNNFRDDPDGIRLLCWRNDQVKLWNTKLRMADYGKKPDKPFIKGDIVIANSACKVNDRIVMNNSEEGEIKSVLEEEDAWFLGVELFSGGMVHVRKLKTSHEKKFEKELNDLAEDKKWSVFWSLKERYHDITHCYALTTHKSQGSTFKKTILDIKDIDLNRNIENRNQLVYVAMTRASDNVYIY